MNNSSLDYKTYCMYNKAGLCLNMGTILIGRWFVYSFIRMKIRYLFYFKVIFTYNIVKYTE